MHLLESLFILLVLIALIVAAILIALAASKLTKIRSYDNSPKGQSAVTWYNWSSTIAWLAAVITTIILIVFLFQNSYSDTHRHNFGTHFFTKFALWMLLILIAIAAIFLFVGYDYMKSFTGFTQGVNIDPSINTYITASMIILGACFLVILIIVILSMLRKPRLHEDEIQYLAEESNGLTEISPGITIG